MKLQGGMAGSDDDDDDDDVGPRPLEDMSGMKGPSGKTNFGGALLPGEGEAIAQYAEKNMRIPRRGEVRRAYLDQPREGGSRRFRKEGVGGCFMLMVALTVL